MIDVVRALLVLIAGAWSTGVAHAGPHDDTFAKGFGVGVAQVHDVVGYELPPGNDATHLLIGRFDAGPYTMTGALVMTCTDTECALRRAEFGAADRVELLGVYDLQGSPTSLGLRGLPATGGRYTKVPGARAMKFPVVAIATRESKPGTARTRAGKQVDGSEHRSKLYLITLLDSDRGSVVLMDTSESRSPAGRGFRRTYRLDRSDPKATRGPLDLIAKEQRSIDRDSRCLEPEPSDIVFVLEERHYRPKPTPPGKPGC